MKNSMPRYEKSNSAKKSKKIGQRRLNKKTHYNDINPNDVVELMRLVNQHDAEAEVQFLSPIKRPNGHYVTSEANLNSWIDPRIFRETQIKRLVRWLATSPPLFHYFFRWLFIMKIGIKAAYFDQQEDHNLDKVFKQGSEHEIQPNEPLDFTIHNLGHATQLIQTSGMNILTDPVFGNLAPVFYPSMTKPFGKNFTAKDLPRIDVILISHNHRDHVDVDSLKQLLKIAQENHITPPQLLVPVGDEELFKSLGYPEVRTFEWHEQITLSSISGEPVTFCSVPADHRSGRNGHDHHKSLVMGWTISPKNRNEILYFAGDTARINNTRIKSLAVDIYQMYKHKKQIGNNELPKVISMIPGGPNYTRKDMELTHQSAVDSIASTFRLAIALNQVSLADQKENVHFSAEHWLNASTSIFMHQNKYELGPDRFNENVFIYSRLLSYLKMDEQELQIHAKKQDAKSKNWSLFHRRKDFIINGVHELRQLAAEIWPNADDSLRNKNLFEFIQARVHFPLINEKLNSKDAYKFKFGEVSTIIPDTFIKGENRRKEEKPEADNTSAPTP